MVSYDLLSLFYHFVTHSFIHSAQECLHLHRHGSVKSTEQPLPPRAALVAVLHHPPIETLSSPLHRHHHLSSTCRLLRCRRLQLLGDVSSPLISAFPAFKVVKLTSFSTHQHRPLPSVQHPPILRFRRSRLRHIHRQLCRPPLLDQRRPCPRSLLPLLSLHSHLPHFPLDPLPLAVALHSRRLGHSFPTTPICVDRVLAGAAV